MTYVIEKPVSPLGYFLVQQLLARGWTRAHLARECGLTPAAITQLINKPNRKPDLTTVEALARVLGCETDVIHQACAHPAEPVNA